MRLRDLIVIALFMIIAIVAVTAAAEEPATWRANTDVTRLQSRFTNSSVASLIDEITLDRFLVPVRVDSFRFVEINGETQLVAAADYSGRGFVSRLFIIRGTGNPRYEIIDAWDVRDVNTRITDLDSDGHIELIVTNLMTSYGGNYPQATYRAVYALHDGHWRDSSAMFANWYRDQELPRIEKVLQERRTIASPGEHDQAATDAAEMERYKVLRLMGGDREAGLATAITWSSDGRPYRRIYAATILTDIHTPVAQDRLKVLQSDSDPRVAEAARLKRSE